MTSTLLKSTSFNNPTIHKLDNGFTIVAEQMPVDVVNFNIWLNVGSILESDAINGMAHFLEHMIFKGSDRLNNGEFERLIESSGAVTNAATSQEYTHYYITTAPKDFAQLAPLQLDVVLNAKIPAPEFEKERLVVLEEIRRAEDDPRRRSFYRAMDTCFDELPYRRPVLGLTSVIEQLKPQQMKDFHRGWYQPKNMTAAVIGNLPTEELIASVTEALEEIQPDYPQTHNRPKFEPEAPFTEIVRREYIDESLQQARLMIMWRVPGINQLAQTYALDVLAAILGQGKVSRLFRDLREEKGLVSQIGVSNMSQGVQGVFYISAQLSQENLMEVERLIIDHIAQIQRELISDLELARIRAQVANRFIFANEKPSDRANLYGYYYSQLKDLEPALNYPSYIQSVEANDVRLAAQKYLATDGYGIVIMKPNS